MIFNDKKAQALFDQNRPLGELVGYFYNEINQDRIITPELAADLNTIFEAVKDDPEVIRVNMWGGTFEYDVLLKNIGEGGISFCARYAIKDIATASKHEMNLKYFADLGLLYGRGLHKSRGLVWLDASGNPQSGDLKNFQHALNNDQVKMKRLPAMAVCKAWIKLIDDCTDADFKERLLERKNMLSEVFNALNSYKDIDKLEHGLLCYAYRNEKNTGKKDFLSRGIAEIIKDYVIKLK